MSYFLIDYLEQRIAACDEMIENAADDSSRRIYLATRQRYLADVERLERQGRDVALN